MTQDPVCVHVRAFASLREALGTGQLLVSVEPGTTVGHLLQRIAADHPQARLAERRLAVAVNRVMAPPEQVLADGDEVALIPPVSGGAQKFFEVTDQPLSVADVTARVSSRASGGIAVFVGAVRGVTRPVAPDRIGPAGAQPAGPGESSAGSPAVFTDYLEYEAYPEMAEETLARIGTEVQERWPEIDAVAIVHRIGRLEVGDSAVIIAVAAAHRRQVFVACQYAIDRVKEIAPIWKREVGPDGASWVEGPESRL